VWIRAPVVLVPRVQHPLARAVFPGQPPQRGLDFPALLVGENPDAVEPGGVCRAGLYVEQQQFPVEPNILAGEKFHHLRIGFATLSGFLPNKVSHRQ
jgi:hypothetical protein